MSDQDEVSEFGAHAVDPGIGSDDDQEHSTRPNNDEDGDEFEPEFRRMTREEVMAVGNRDEDGEE
ncbi:hypothetical protein [Natrinema sp. DC36]|uniref:hypothetical protein n=1 Tax=Natrinema sp. DC36 TaxID=2878680 RepID=UPI001CF01EB9|nr:hypothetical protein [Natrinema sp. DC36]